MKEYFLRNSLKNYHPYEQVSYSNNNRKRFLWNDYWRPWFRTIERKSFYLTRTIREKKIFFGVQGSRTITDRPSWSGTFYRPKRRCSYGTSIFFLISQSMRYIDVVEQFDNKISLIILNIYQFQPPPKFRQ